MNKKHACVMFFCIATMVAIWGLYASLKSSPTLTILENGRPLANVSLTALPSLNQLTTDLNGTVNCVGNSQTIMVPKKGGGVRVVKLPKHGSMTVDFRGKQTITTTRTDVLGVYATETVTEQFDLSDDQVSAIEQGRMSLEEVQEEIRGVKADPAGGNRK